MRRPMRSEAAMGDFRARMARRGHATPVATPIVTQAAGMRGQVKVIDPELRAKIDAFVKTPKREDG